MVSISLRTEVAELDQRNLRKTVATVDVMWKTVDGMDKVATVNFTSIAGL